MILSSEQQLDYPKGTLKVSRVTGLNDKDVLESISLDRILDAYNNLEHALLATYRLDEKWLLNQFQPTTPLTLVSNETYERKTRRGENVNWVTPILFNPERQLIHSKFMLLFYRTHMRFVVSTGDLTEDSWKYMPNSVFIQDFPLDSSREFRANQFSMSLAYSLHDLNISLNVVERLNHVDFRLACAHIVTTIPNQLKDNKSKKPRLVKNNMEGNMKEYGMLRLAKVIADLYGDPSMDEAVFDPNTQLLCATASLGYLNDRWLEEIYLCANGAKPQWAGGSKYLNDFDKDLVDISVAFPTQQQFEDCKNQDQCQKLIMAGRKLYEGHYFVQNALVKCMPRYKDTLVDTKMIVARVGEDRDKGWLYMGSHNFTSAAWGKPQRDRSSLYYNNYEFGIIIPKMEFTKEPTGDQMWWRYRKVSLPFKLDFRPYGEYEEPYFSTLANK